MPLIVHLVPETADAGAENQARYLITGLREQGDWEVEVAYFRVGRAHDQFQSLGIPLREVPHTRRLIFNLPRRVRALRSLYAERAPAILHAWLDEANLVAALAVSRWPAAKLVISQRCARPAYRRVPYWPWALRAVRGRVDHAIANSEGGLKFLLDLGYSRERTSLIRNGLPTDGVSVEAPPETLRAQARRVLSLPADESVVGFVGRPDEAKDLGTLFEAMAAVWRAMPRTRLLLLGPTDHDLGRLGLRPSERAVALGWRPMASKLMPAFDVLALSSITEGHSNAVDEALIAGVPVATTNVGGHAPLVAEVGGRVVPARRGDLLGAAILGLLHCPPPRAQIRTWAASRLAMPPIVDATHGLYSALLDGRPGLPTRRSSTMAAR